VTAKRKKIAVIFAHGMGEQIPMETLIGFVEAAWVANTHAQWAPPSDENPSDTWFTPDPMTGSLELRRITTRWTKSKVSPESKGPRVDFFEFYWADLAEGTTVQEVWDWLRTLLVRWPKQVPKGLMGAWLLLWAAAAIVAILSFFAVAPWPGGWWHLALAIAAAIVGYLMQYVVSPSLGDVARYVRAEPRNIAIRHAIRDRGLKLLRDIHESGAYERIIVVAHSLGTIIAYDLISFLWATREPALLLHEDEPAFKKLRAVESAGHSLANATDTDRDQKRRAYREAQRTLRLALRSGGEDGTERARRSDEEWLISDFVTLGSPLTHAQFLLARDETDFANKITRWLFPTNCPQFEVIQSEQREKINAREGTPPAEVLGPPGGLFSYFLRSPKTWSMHDAAPFAAVRWTNIYDSHQRIFQGDIISGPVAPIFGEGIRDIDLKALRGQSPVFSHTLYWTLPTGSPPPPHIEVMHKAIDLLDRPDGDIWQAAHRESRRENAH
jgi:hypothetical protein